MKAKNGVLTLVPTPISELGELNPQTKNRILSAIQEEKYQILCEEPKSARRRWIKYGLPREEIERFAYFNEHNSGTHDTITEVIQGLQQGINYFLLSDCGLPGFCDPGQKLVSSCHDQGIRVTSTCFYSSPVLALALSGFGDRHLFHGFLAKDRNSRTKEINQIINQRLTTIMMDTPYRMMRLLEELQESESKLQKSHTYFLAASLNEVDEFTMRGSLSSIIPQIKVAKAPFILIKKG